MNWRIVIDAFKRLDERLSDAVYFHGCTLAGLETPSSSSTRNRKCSTQEAASDGLHHHRERGYGYSERQFQRNSLRNLANDQRQSGVGAG